MFYDRHVHAVLGYFARRTRDLEVAADLTAETFASALASRRRYKLGRVPAGACIVRDAARRLADLRASARRRGAGAGGARDGAGAAAQRRRCRAGAVAGRGRGGEPAGRAAAESARSDHGLCGRRRQLRHVAGRHQVSELVVRQGREPRARRAAQRIEQSAMSDYITELRRELVGAAERQQPRSVRRRAVIRWRRPTSPVMGRRSGRPPHRHRRGQPRALELRLADRVVATVRFGGIPTGAALGASSVWVTGLDGSLWRIDLERPSRRRDDRRRHGGEPGLGVGRCRLGGRRREPPRPTHAPRPDRSCRREDRRPRPRRVLRRDPGRRAWRRLVADLSGSARPLTCVDPATNRIAASRKERADRDRAAGGGRLWTLLFAGSARVAQRDDGRPAGPGRRAGAGSAGWGVPQRDRARRRRQGIADRRGRRGDARLLRRPASAGACGCAPTVPWPTRAVPSGSPRDVTDRHNEIVRLDPGDGHLTYGSPWSAC